MGERWDEIDLATTGTYTVVFYSFILPARARLGSLTYTKLGARSYRLAIGHNQWCGSADHLGAKSVRPTTLRMRRTGSQVQWFTLTNFNLPWTRYRFVDWLQPIHRNDSTNRAVECPSW